MLTLNDLLTCIDRVLCHATHVSTCNDDKLSCVDHFYHGDPSFDLTDHALMFNDAFFCGWCRVWERTSPAARQTRCPEFFLSFFFFFFFLLRLSYLIAFC